MTSDVLLPSFHGELRAATDDVQSASKTSMLIRLGYDMQFDLPAPVSSIAQLRIHPSRIQDLREKDELRVEGSEGTVATRDYIDAYGNICTRFYAPAGELRLWNSTLIEDSGLTDAVNEEALEVPAQDLPDDVLIYLLSSRYCEVDLLSPVAMDLFGETAPGWQRVQAICSWIHSKVTFNYATARATRTALGVFTERVGVCRDFQHLAVTFCRCLNIPARYVAGYLGDIGVPATSAPMDFSAWFEAYLDGRWWTFDARHNAPRIGRVLMATGRDAADVAFLTSFGVASLRSFQVTSEEVMPVAE
ncbi:transglutaminase family protein [Acidicapsa dinghuensis]|uniref:Transglutaminase family protein n=1 Tax=Acidicapsa dinghuensis TaxID=2218256 RepID=A0ABW1E9N6_9BACT|nr:transglutaminase family protein [Acidicapsa dinghuensis]